MRRVRALLLGEAARLLAVVEAEDGGPAPDGAEQAVEPVVRGRAVGLDVRRAEVDEVAEQRLVVLGRELVPADLRELELDLDDVCGRQPEAHTYSSTCA